MKKILISMMVIASAWIAGAQNPTVVDLSVTQHGPEKGTLVIIGGGRVTDEVWDRFLELAGGENAKIVVITNASGPGETGHMGTINYLSKRLGEDRVTQMHLTTIDEANDDKNLKPLREATGVYFTGGRQ